MPNHSDGKTLKDRLTEQKPWAVMDMTRRQYQRAKPWKAAKGKMSKAQFEDMIRLLGAERPDIFDRLREDADAERLVNAMFGVDVES